MNGRREGRRGSQGVSGGGCNRVRTGKRVTGGEAGGARRVGQGRNRTKTGHGRARLGRKDWR